MSAPWMVSEREAGPELDALIDEKVFGYRWFDVGPNDLAPKTCTQRLARPRGDRYYGHIRAERHADGHVVVLGGREYSSKIADAWRVVEALQQRGLFVNVENFPPTTPDRYRWRVTISSPVLTQHHEHGESAPLAICRAALLAVADDVVNGRET